MIQISRNQLKLKNPVTDSQGNIDLKKLSARLDDLYKSYYWIASKYQACHPEEFEGPLVSAAYSFNRSEKRISNEFVDWWVEGDYAHMLFQKEDKNVFMNLVHFNPIFSDYPDSRLPSIVQLTDEIVDRLYKYYRQFPPAKIQPIDKNLFKQSVEYKIEVLQKERPALDVEDTDPFLLLHDGVQFEFRKVGKKRVSIAGGIPVNYNGKH